MPISKRCARPSTAWARFSANVSPEPFARGFGHGFTIDFRDAAARDAYLAHEAHQRAGARLVAALEGGADGLMVLDLEFTEM
nr:MULTISPECIES: Dabb family protein [unclassified Mesorhizobium]